MPLQFVGNDGNSRAGHIWYRREDKKFKCVLCGEVVRIAYSATLEDGIVPQVIEKLTDEERAMAPFLEAKPNES